MPWCSAPSTLLDESQGFVEVLDGEIVLLLPIVNSPPSTVSLGVVRPLPYRFVTIGERVFLVSHIEAVDGSKE